MSEATVLAIVGIGMCVLFLAMIAFGVYGEWKLARLIRKIEALPPEERRKASEVLWRAWYLGK